jgi:pilus assembly protein CpaE
LWKEPELFNSLVICPDQELSGRLEAALRATGQVSDVRVMDRYPGSVEVVRCLRAQAAEILFLSFESVTEALDTVKVLEGEASSVQVVAIHRLMDPVVLRESMRSGIREFLVDPFDPDAVMESLAHVKALLERRPASYGSTNEIFSFLPSKAGAGNSTLVLNVSAALARKPGTRVLLSDFDLNSGMMRFMMKLSNAYSVTDAIENSSRMDDNLWPQLVSKFEQLEVLNAGPVNPSYRMEAGQIRNLVAFMRRNYKVLCFDLSGNLERYSIELMQESKRVFMVCTPEVPSLHLAREKLQFLKKIELHSRVSILLNRVPKKPLLTKDQVEDILGTTVTTVFPNDYHGVNGALTRGAVVSLSSELGRAFAQFADGLVEDKSQERANGKRKFLEFFTTPAETFASNGK